jgi:uncharacterized protein YcfL
MARLLALLALTATIFMVVGCGAEQSGPASPESNEASETQQTAPDMQSNTTP